MKKISEVTSDGKMSQVIDISLRLGILFVLLGWAFLILRPFVSIVIWGIIIAVSLYPLHLILTKKLGDFPKLSAGIISLMLLAVLLVPSAIFTESVVEGISNFSSGLDAESFHLPPPDPQIAEWPVIGNTIYDIWSGASNNLEDEIMNYSEQLKSVGNWLLTALMGTGLGILQLLVSIIIGGVFLGTSEKGANFSNKLFRRVVGPRGDEFARTSEITVRNVSKGVIGVAIIQSLLAGIVFMLAGVPYAGLWTLISLILCIIQIGPGLVIIPVIIYLFTIYDNWIAVLWTIALVFVMLSDNIIKPFLMGKGAPVPMLVIFLGSLGGFIAFGFIGLFLGAIVLSLVYKLVLTWIEDEREATL